MQKVLACLLACLRCHVCSTPEYASRAQPATQLHQLLFHATACKKKLFMSIFTEHCSSPSIATGSSLSLFPCLASRSACTGQAAACQQPQVLHQGGQCRRRRQRPGSISHINRHQISSVLSQSKTTNLQSQAPVGILLGNRQVSRRLRHRVASKLLTARLVARWQGENLVCLRCRARRSCMCPRLRLTRLMPRMYRSRQVRCNAGE